MGSWSIFRHFGAQGLAVGQAAFTLLTPSLLAYREDLEVHIPGFSEAVYQEYLYVFEEGCVYKKFKDNRLFYRLEVSNAEATGAHLCGEDHYQAHYSFLGQNNFTLTYRVKGPRKDYEILTEFTRA